MKLKELRKQNKKTQEEMAKLLNVKQVTYGRYELESSEPDIQTLVKLADYYNVSLDYIVGRSFNNDIGYLTEEQRNCILMVKQLNQLNLMKATSYIMGLMATQG